MIEFLKAVHGYSFPFSADLMDAVPLLALIPGPLALTSLVLFIWSLAPAFKGEVGAGFVAWLRLTWVLTFIPMVTGIALAVSGGKVASSVLAPTGTDFGTECLNYAARNGWATETLTRYCLPVDPARDLEHWMYTSFTLLSLLAVEALARRRWDGNFLGVGLGLKLLPVITLFLYGCVYMIGRVAILPGNGVLGQ